MLSEYYYWIDFSRHGFMREKQCIDFALWLNDRAYCMHLSFKTADCFSTRKMLLTSILVLWWFYVQRYTCRQRAGFSFQVWLLSVLLTSFRHNKWSGPFLWYTVAMKGISVSSGFGNECLSLAVIPGELFASSPAYHGLLCRATLHVVD